jgi:hypothetical protein
MMEFKLICRASRKEIEGVLKYLKNNKAAGADSIVAELLKNGASKYETIVRNPLKADKD